MNVPNFLTGLRFVMVPLYACTFALEGPLKLWSVLIFVLASITDVLDGYIARKYNLTTKWGQLADPLADKLMQITVLICLTVGGILPLWFVVLVAAKELAMILCSTFLYTKKTYVKSNIFGKLNTVVLFIILCAFHLIPNIPAPLTTTLLVISLGLSFFATGYYAYCYLKKPQESPLTDK